MTVFLKAYARLTPFTCLRLPDIPSEAVFFELLDFSSGGTVRWVAAGGDPCEPRTGVEVA